MWSKQGRDLTDRFPDIVGRRASPRCPAGTVLDGEVVIWNGSRLDFGLLQQRMVTAAGRIAALVAAHPASYVAFDLLAAGGADLRGQRLSRRRAALEELAERWAPPMQLSPATTDPAEARRWFDDFRPAGVEGLVAKGAGTRYAPGRREWLKVKSWETTEVLAGGVIGPIERAQPARRRPLPGRRARRRRPDQPAVPAPVGGARRRPDARRTTTIPGPTGSAPAGSAAAGSRCRSPASTRASSSRSAPTPRCRPASSGTRCGSCACAPTSSPATSRRSREAQRAVRPRRVSTRRSSGAKTSSSIATPDHEDQHDRGDDQRHLGQLAARC